MTFRGSIVVILLGMMSFSGCTREQADQKRRWIDANVRLHQLQMLGSHNSYKKAIDASILKLIEEENPEQALALDYSHLPLDEQLSLDLRVLELDIFHDPEGGRYAQPGGIEIVRERELPPCEPYDVQAQMLQPGFKVMHVQDIDFRSHCFTLRQGLTILQNWSDSHPGHLPIIITMNAKDEVMAREDFVQPLPFDKPAFDSLDEVVRSVLGFRLITPDDVRGEYSSLEAAVLAQKWPTLGEARGRFLFVLDEGGEKVATYLDGHPSLKGRVFFVDVPPGTPESAVRILNDPVEQAEEIRRLVRLGYLVRTRADADTVEARQGNTQRAQAAFASGAHFISTDYYVPDTRLGTGYQVKLPGASVARWNPLWKPGKPDWGLTE